MPLGNSNALKIKNLKKNFGALKVIDDLDLVIQSGERRSILGANGAGKTTLFNLITGDITADKGSIFFFGEDITHTPVHERTRKGLRRTYQKSLLFKNLSVLENLIIAIKGISSNRFTITAAHYEQKIVTDATEIMKKLGLDKLKNTIVAELSHGVSRQLEIGMALAGKPRLILFDEPAAGLSPVERKNLLRIFKQLPAEITYIVIEHDMDIALQISQFITVMHKGRFFAEGTPQDIFSNKEVRKIYLGF